MLSRTQMLIFKSRSKCWLGSATTRATGVEKNQAPWHLRWFYGMTRKMFGKDLTPAKIQMRVPGIVWGGILMEMASAESVLFRCGTFSWAKCAPPVLNRHQFCRGQKSRIDR
jgi:hypothetical protein